MKIKLPWIKPFDALALPDDFEDQVKESFGRFTVETNTRYTWKDKMLYKIDELSFRQLVDDKYTEQHYLEDYLRMGHKKLWWYIEQNDYNLYYAENEVSCRYRDFEKKAEDNGK